MNNTADLEPVLVTGAGGFVGGYLVRYLHHYGIKVRAMVRSAAKASDLSALGIEVVEADLLRPETLENAVKGCNSVIHIAALFRQAGLPDSVYRAVNAEATRILLDLSVALNIRRFIHCSTVGVHSHIENPPGDETTPYAPADIYQITKMEGEKIALEYFNSGKISGLVIRPAMIYGPGDQRTLKLFKSISKGRFFFVGKGEVHVHFIDVRDLVRAFARAWTRIDINSEVFIIAGRESVPLKEAVRRISLFCGVAMPRMRIPVKPLQLLGDICEAICTPFKINPPIYRRRVDFFTKNRHFDNSKAKNVLGFMPAMHFDQELREIIDWYSLHGYLPLLGDKKQIAKECEKLQPEHIAVHPFNISAELVREITSNYLSSEHASAAASVIVRHLDGTIIYWNHGSENIYGWSRYEAEGRISHHILQTVYEEPLREVNNKLLANKKCDLSLVHTNKDGKTLQVRSTWEIMPNNNLTLVVETNNLLVT